MLNRIMIVGVLVLSISSGCTKKKSSGSSGSTSTGTSSSSTTNGVYSTTSMAQSSPGSLPSGLSSGNWNNSQLKAIFSSGASNFQDDGISEVVDFNGSICWVGFSSQLFQGRNLWCRINGTNVEANTNPEGDDSSGTLTVVGSNLYFISKTTVGYKLFKFDGTTVSQISNVNPGSSDEPSALTKIGSSLYLSMGHLTDVSKAGKAYVYDGTQLTALSETNPGNPDWSYGFVPYKTGACYSSAVSNDSSYHIFCHLQSGLQAVTELNPSGYAYHGEMIQLGDNLYFTGYDGTSYGIFRYDGASTSLVYAGLYINSLYALGTKLLFSYYDQTSLTQEFGLVETTTLNFAVPFDVCSGCSDNISNFKAVSGGVVFLATSTQGQKLYFWDGSSPNPVRWSNTAGDGNSDNLFGLTVSGLSSYFLASTGTETRAFVRSSNGAVQTLPETFVGEDDSAWIVVPIGSDVYYVSRSTLGTKLFHYNGSTSVAISGSKSGGDEYVERIYPYQSGTVYVGQASGGKKLFYFNGTTVSQISNAYPNGDDQPDEIVIGGSSLYFIASVNSQGHRKVFYFNGTTTIQVPDSGSDGNDLPEQLAIGSAAMGRHLYFVANKLNSVSKPVKRLFEFDGSQIHQLTNFNDDGDEVAFVSPVSNGVYFIAKERSRGLISGLYFYDGTNVTRVTGSADLDQDFKVELMKVINNQLYMYADFTGGWKLYLYDGTSIQPLSDSNPGRSDQVSQVTEFNGSLVYIAYDGSINHLYRLNGTTSQIISDSDNVMQTFVDGSNLYFVSNASGNYKLHRFNGTQSVQVSDTNPGGDDGIGVMAALNGKLYFSANNSTKNRIHVFDGSVTSEITSILPGSDLKVMSMVSQSGKLFFSTYYQGKGISLQYQP